MKFLSFLLFLIIFDGVTSVFLEDRYRHKKDKDCYNENPPPPPPTAAPTPPPPPSPPRLGGNCPVTITNHNGPPPSNACEAGWTAFSRVKGVRCLKTFTGAVNQTTAVSLCEAQNAVLSGIENSNERDWIHEQFRPLVANVSVVRTVWLGAVRKPQCAVLTDFPASCSPKQTQMFYWTDTSVTGTDGFCPWWDTDPDNYEGKALQPCLQFAILRGTAPVGQWNATQGSLDDNICSLAGPTLIGYVCSKASV